MAERQEDLRAADADRAQVADRLRMALEEGRLDLHEYDERLQRTYSAKTYGDLNGILDDLPAPAPASRSQVAKAASPPVSAAPQPVADQGRSTPGWLKVVWSAWFFAVFVNVVIWALVSLGSRHAVYFWPMWVAGPWGAVLLMSTFLGLAGGHPDGRRQARDAYRQARRDARRQGRRYR